MPPKLSLTPEENIIYQRDRNRRKQQSLRDRRKAAALAVAEQMEGGQGGGGGEGSKPKRARSSKVAASQQPVCESGPSSRKSGLDEETTESSFYQAEEGSRREERSSTEAKVVGGVLSSLSWFIKPLPLAPPPTSFAREANNVVPLPPSSVESASSQLTSASLFAALLNGFFPSPPRSPPTRLSATRPFASSSTLQTINPHLLQPSSQVSTYPTIPRYLPSYSYESPVDSSSPNLAPNWKWSLFQLHKACHNHRSHPTEGYLHNKVAEATVAEAQLMILRLLGSTSPNKELYDSRRKLSQEDRDYLAHSPMDPRVLWSSDPLSRVLVQKASVAGVIKITEMVAIFIESAIFCGDVWDSGSVSMPDELYQHIPVELRGQGGRRSEAGSRLRGATVREIALGLEQPGWRRAEPIFPIWERDHWEVVEQVYSLHSRRMLEA